MAIQRKIPVTYPLGVISTAYDSYDNHWALVKNNSGLAVLHVLGAGKDSWSSDTGLPEGNWHDVFEDEKGYIWVQSLSHSMKMHPKNSIWENQYVKVAKEADYTPWKMVSRMPGGNHDLSGEVYNGNFYMAGGLTAGWGYPAKTHVFSDIFRFDLSNYSWEVLADIGYPVCYCATACLNNKVWVMGGDIFDSYNNRCATDKVRIYNTLNGSIEDGPSMSIPRPMPLAFNVNNRIYIFGNPRNRFNEPALIESIGSGEHEWRKETPGPSGMGALAGAALNGKIYILVEHLYMAVYDAITCSWETFSVPESPRSAQVTAHKGEIWVMGGRINQINAQSPVTTNKTWIYTPETRKWREGVPMPKNLAWGTAFSSGDAVFVVGGVSNISDTCYSNRTFMLEV